MSARLPVPSRLGRLRGALVAVACVFLATACGRSSSASNDAPASGSASASAVAPSAATARIVSVGGQVTETLFALGVGPQVVGVDTSSVFPDAATKLPHVGYQRSLAAEGILSLKPTLVIASTDAGPPAVLEQLKGAGVRVEMIPAEPTVAAAKERIVKIGALVGRDGASVLAELEADLGRAHGFVGKATSHPKVLAIYARGANTLHVLGKGTAGESMVELAGGQNAGNGFDGSKPMTAEAVVQAAPDVVLIPSRGLDSVGGLEGLSKVPGIAETPAGRSKRFVAMDDLLLLGFGPRTGKAAIELGQKIHPELSSVTP